MAFYFNVILFIFVFQEIISFLIISMEVKKVDNCIRKIELDDGTSLYVRYDTTCNYNSGNNLDYNIPIFEPLPYEIGHKIKIVIGDKGGGCFFKMDIFVNNETKIKDDIKFWDCDNCFNQSFNYDNRHLYCYPDDLIHSANDYNFYFNINSLEQLDFNISEYYYYLNNINNNYISSTNFNNAINLIDLFSENILYAKNSEGNIITPFYKYIYYK